MKAPARSIENGELLPFFEVQAGRRVYRQIDDELLSDVQGEVKMGGILGMMIARVREAEKDTAHYHELWSKVRDVSNERAAQCAKLGEACDIFRAKIEETEQRAGVAERGCQTLSAQLEEANKDLQHFRGYAKHSTYCEAYHDQNDRNPNHDCSCGFDRPGREEML